MTVTAPAPTTPEQYLALVAIVRDAAARYYDQGDSPLDDATYDQHVRTIEAFEQAHPDQVHPDSPTGKVGAGAAPDGDVAHTTAMLSLKKAHGHEDLVRWETSLRRRLGRAPQHGFAVEAKLDGASLAARYRDGRLVQLILRGNHATGTDVSFQIGYINGLPLTLARPLTLEVRGEVVMTADQYEEAQELRRQYGDKPFSNRRNAAAGSLRAKDRPYQVGLSFYAFAGVELDGQPLPDGDDTHTGLISALAGLGLNTLLDSPIAPVAVATLAEAEQQIATIAKARPSLPFRIDGVVIKAQSLADHAEAGTASDHPYAAVAFKLPPVERTTRLREVTFSVGRTGRVTPRARLEPIELDGSTVEFATLHHPGMVETLDLHIGDLVVVYKGGDIIPNVEGPVADQRTGTEQRVVLPEVCPKCGGPLAKTGKNAKIWECVGDDGCRVLPRLVYAVGREQLDIEGLGKQALTTLVENEEVGDIADLFTLTRAQLANALGSDKRVPPVLARIEAAKSLPLHRVLCALGVPATGRRVSKQLASRFGTMAAVQAADAAAVASVEKVPGANAPKIVAGIAHMSTVITKLAEAGVNLTEPQQAPAATGGPLAGRSVCVTGTMTGPLAALKRPDVKALIERAGGTVTDSVSGNTSLLVTGTNAGSKLAKATKLGVPVMDEDAFAELVADYLP